MTPCPMRTFALAILALLALAPLASAEEMRHSVYLHEFDQGLHLLPEQINANVGDTLVLDVLNQGASQHDFLVCGDEPDVEPQCKDVWGKTRVLEANQTQTITIEAKRAGTFDYYCSLFSHKQLNMHGQLVVAGADESNAVPLGPLALVALLATALVARRWRS